MLSPPPACSSVYIRRSLSIGLRYSQGERPAARNGGNSCPFQTLRTLATVEHETFCVADRLLKKPFVGVRGTGHECRVAPHATPGIANIAIATKMVIRRIIRLGPGEQVGA